MNEKINIEVEKELIYLLIKQQEEHSFHAPIDEEVNFYRSVQAGNLDVLKGVMEVEPTAGMGKLSSDRMRNIKYHLIILAAMLTRFCIEGGMHAEQAYTLSDIYIRKIDVAVNKQDLLSLKRALITEYTLAMFQIRHASNKSYHVKRACEYIEKHVSEKISSSLVAEQISLNRDYLTRLFKKEMGFGISKYIMLKKCEMAVIMLGNSKASCTEIAMFLNFSSCSYFISQFKKVYQMTPEEYRKRKFDL